MNFVFYQCLEYVYSSCFNVYGLYVLPISKEVVVKVRINEIIKLPSEANVFQSFHENWSCVFEILKDSTLVISKQKQSLDSSEVINLPHQNLQIRIYK